MRNQDSWDGRRYWSAWGTYKIIMDAGANDEMKGCERLVLGSVYHYFNILYNLCSSDEISFIFKAILPITLMFPFGLKQTQNVNGHERNYMLNNLVTKSCQNSN